MTVISRCPVAVWGSMLLWDSCGCRCSSWRHRETQVMSALMLMSNNLSSVYTSLCSLLIVVIVCFCSLSLWRYVIVQWSSRSGSRFLGKMGINTVPYRQNFATVLCFASSEWNCVSDKNPTFWSLCCPAWSWFTSSSLSLQTTLIVMKRAAVFVILYPR